AASPSFAAPTNFSVTATFVPGSVATGDFNGDGKPDFAVTDNQASRVSVFLNTTSSGAVAPTFSAATDFVVGSLPQSLAVVDLNGDGKLDLAITNLTIAGTVSVMLNTTPPGATVPTFTTPVFENPS